ncbi:MAG: hypothetical protein KDA20_03115 [Phycisphaerales bacterium]|nr:hypothetical protein [Phycisphaerales bacterium]
MPIAILFDDAYPLAPLTELRASFELRTGALTTLERHAAILQASGVQLAAIQVPADCEACSRERNDMRTNPHDLAALMDKGDDRVLVINGRYVLPNPDIAQMEPGTAFVEAGASRAVIVACLTPADAGAFLHSGHLPANCKAETVDEQVLLRRPWDVIRFRDDAIEVDLALLASRKSAAVAPGVVVIEGYEDDDNAQHHLVVSKSATVYPTALLDVSDGPIVIDDDASVRPYAIIRGPAYIGRGSMVLEQSHIKPHTSIGPVCKVAGEVGGCIFQGFANKSHDGHLGDSWIGEWVNLGAGTTNSNLLNTYGEVTVQRTPGGPRERTDMRYLGCLLGDHVKTAICTRITTGAIVGTGAMLAASTWTPASTPSFAWVTDRGATHARWPRFIETAKAMMARRGVTPGHAYITRLRELHECAIGQSAGQAHSAHTP